MAEINDSEFVDIEGYEGRYAVNRLGQVLSRYGNGRLLKSSKTKQGYLLVNLYHPSTKKRKFYYVHRLVAIIFIPNPQGKRTVNHVDGNKQNNRIDNLEWATYMENTNHALYNLGSMAANQKLTLEQVRDIKLGLSHLSAGLVSSMFNVHLNTVHGIRSGERWQHVTERTDKETVKTSEENHE